MSRTMLLVECWWGSGDLWEGKVVEREKRSGRWVCYVRYTDLFPVGSTLDWKFSAKAKQ